MKCRPGDDITDLLFERLQIGHFLLEHKIRCPEGGEMRPQNPHHSVDAMSDKIDIVRGWVDTSAQIVALTGAGISTESGIPDFRGPQGVWTRNPGAEKLSNIHHYMSDPEVRTRSWQSRLANPAWQAKPNAGHHALVELERRGKLHALVTQNIDGLHQRAGNAPHKVIEVHGTMHEVVCMKCQWCGPTLPVLDRVRAGETDPRCEHCRGILKTATISFGQSLVPEVIARAMQVAKDAHLLLAIGTSLQVYPVAGAVPAAKTAGARVVIINAEPTPFDEVADVVLPGPIGEVLPLLCGGAESRTASPGPGLS